MISFSDLLSRLDLLIYVCVVVVIYIALIFLWKKIAQLETSFMKMENTFAMHIINQEKTNTPKENRDAEDVFVEVFTANEIPQGVPEPTAIIEEITEKDTKEPEEIDTESTHTASQPSKSKLAKMSVDQLREYCGNNSISTEGTKQELINKILNQS